jgi:hypothetical protein
MSNRIPYRPRQPRPENLPPTDDCRVAYYPPLQPGQTVLIPFTIEATRGDVLLKARRGARTMWIRVDDVEGVKAT